MASEMIFALVTGAVGAGVVTVIGNVLMFFLNRKASKKDRAEDRYDEELEVTLKEHKAVIEGMKALLHDRLYQSCKRYIERNEVTLNELSNLRHLYNAYHKIGGNGTGTALYNRVLQLPIAHDDSEEE